MQLPHLKKWHAYVIYDLEFIVFWSVDLCLFIFVELLYAEIPWRQVQQEHQVLLKLVFKKLKINLSFIFSFTLVVIDFVKLTIACLVEFCQFVIHWVWLLLTWLDWLNCRKYSSHVMLICFLLCLIFPQILPLHHALSIVIFCLGF